MSSNLTLAVDAAVVARAREVARQQGTSLNALIRDFLERLAGRSGDAQVWQELRRQWAEGSGDSGGGYRFRREDAYEEPRGRTRLR
jgi:hypothetical protein